MRVVYALLTAGLLGAFLILTSPPDHCVTGSIVTHCEVR
jgi:hypothetical protein